MRQRLGWLRSLGLAALIGLAAGLWMPVAAQQAGSVNPTAQSVKEQDLLRALQPGGTIAGRVSIPDARAANLIQPEGRDWRAFNQETLPRLGAIAILGILLALAAFFALRGRIRIDSGRSGTLITRFNGFERFTHWLTAGSFIVLAITGLNVTFGKTILLPVLGGPGFSAWSQLAKYVHNYIGFAFMLGVLLTFLIWVKDNIPSGRDVAWLAAGGGLLKRGHHPEAKRFNAGQKVVFWLVVVGGFFLSLSGLNLLFPFQIGGGGIQNLQWQSTLHGSLAVVMVAAMLAHAYIGSIGMEGAFDAMGSGEVDLNWAREHHSLWVEEQMSRQGRGGPAPAMQPAE